MSRGITVADFIRLRRKKREILKRFESVEKRVLEKEPELYETILRLRDEGRISDSALDRISIHSDLMKEGTPKESDLEEDLLRVENSDRKGIIFETRKEVDLKGGSMKIGAVKKNEKEAELCPDIEKSPHNEPNEETTNNISHTDSAAESLAADPEGEEEEENESDVNQGEAESSPRKSECSPRITEEVGVETEEMENELSDDIEMILDPTSSPQMALSKNQKLKYKPRLNVVWQLRLEASQKEREERIKGTETCKPESHPESLKPVKNKAYASIPCRIYEKHPKALDILDPEVDRRKSLPQAQSSLNKDSHQSGQDRKIGPRGNRSSELRYLKSTSLKSNDADL